MRYSSSLSMRLARYLQLTNSEQVTVGRIEQDEFRVMKGDLLMREGAADSRLLVVKAGWAVVRSSLNTERSAILRIHLPGEIIGLAELGSPVVPHPVVMQTEGIIASFDRSEVPRLWVNEPRLMGMLTGLASLEQIAGRDYLFALTRLTAAETMIHFLLTIRARLAVSIHGMGDRFLLPFSQQELGAILGLTSVYVNRLLKGFAEAGEVEIDRPYIRLLARQDWTDRIGFRDRFADLDTSWFTSAV